MLIVISAIASTIALFGALLVGYSTQQTIKGMVPKRDPTSALVAFPDDVEQQLKQQQMVTAGVATLQVDPRARADQLAASLRETINRAGDGLSHEAEGQHIDSHEMAVALESLLLSSESSDLEPVGVREYALRQLTARDGSIELPNFIVGAIGADDGLDQQVASQLSQLQRELNQQIAALPELEGREISLRDIRLDDLQQVAAAIEALELQGEMFGVDLSESVRYKSLQSLSEELLGGNVSLEGLDLSELEAVSRELLSQLGGDTTDSAAGD